MTSSPWDTACSLCASLDHAGTLTVAPGGAAPALPGVLYLCTPCFAFLVDSCRAGLGQGEGARQQEDGCCACGAPQASPLHTLAFDAAPGRVEGGLSRLRPGASMRLCDLCLGWVEALVEHESASRWGQRRQDVAVRTEAPVPGGACVGVGLSAADERIAQEVVSAAGGRFTPRGGAIADPGAIFLVHATPSGEGEAFVSSLAAAARGRVAVVTSPGAVRDAAAMLRAGAADLLASPLSRQQVAGALRRLVDPPPVLGRDAATGLPQYALAARDGLPAHRLRVALPRPRDLFETVLVLRRFLRGDDLVTVTPEGEPAALVSCSPDEVGVVARRLARLLGPGFQVMLTEVATPPEEVPPVPPPALRPSPGDASPGTPAVRGRGRWRGSVVDAR